MQRSSKLEADSNPVWYSIYHLSSRYSSLVWNQCRLLWIWYQLGASFCCGKSPVSICLRSVAQCQDFGSKTRPRFIKIVSSKLFYPCSKYFELIVAVVGWGFAADLDLSSLSVDTRSINAIPFQPQQASMASHDDDDTVPDLYRRNESSSGSGSFGRTDTINTSSTTTTKRDNRSISERFSLQSLTDLQQIYCSRRPPASM